MGILRKHLDELGLPTEGNKPELVERLNNAIGKWLKKYTNFKYTAGIWYFVLFHLVILKFKSEAKKKLNFHANYGLY